MPAWAWVIIGVIAWMVIVVCAISLMAAASSDDHDLERTKEQRNNDNT